MGTCLRRTRLALAAAGCALACAGIALAAPGDPRRHFNPTDQATAKTFLLVKADLPGKGWVGKATDFSQPNPACFVKGYSLAALTVTGEAGFSYLLRQGGAEVESDGHVFRNDAEAGRAFAILSKPGLGGCVSSSFAASLAKQVKGSKTKVVKLSAVPLAGLPATANGFRAEIALNVGGKSGPLELIVLNLRHGRSLGSLNLVAPAGAWTPALVETLAVKMALRMAKR